jgi:hypothetical protein
VNGGQAGSIKLEKLSDDRFLWKTIHNISRYPSHDLRNKDELNGCDVKVWIVYHTLFNPPLYRECLQLYAPRNMFAHIHKPLLENGVAPPDMRLIKKE